MTILACIDQSRYTAAVCDYAAREALKANEGIRLLHVVERQPAERLLDQKSFLSILDADRARDEYSRIAEDQRWEAERAARKLLNGSADRLRAAGVTQVEEEIVFGSLIDGVRTHCVDTRMVVIGRRGEGEDQARAHLGSNLERVVRECSCPILVVPAEVRSFRKMVIAYDGSLCCRRSISALTTKPGWLEASCDLVMVESEGFNAQELLDVAAEDLRKFGYTVNTHVLTGDADEAILQFAREKGAGLLVVGAHGHSRVREMIIGSTTTTLMRQSTIPLLIIR